MVNSAAALAQNPRYRRWFAFAVTAAAALGIVVASIVGRPADPAERLENARDLVFNKKPEAALREVRRALAELGDDGSPALRQKALARAAQIADFHLSDAHVTEALGYYRALVDVDPTTDLAFDAGQRVAEILRQRLHDDVHADQQLVAVANAFPAQQGVERLLLRAAQSSLDGRRYELARETASALLARYPTSPLGADAQIVIASTYHLEGRLPEATKAFEVVAERWPRSETAGRALFEAGNCLADQSDYGHAIARYIEALPTHPDPMLVQRSLERARRYFSALRAMDPGSKAVAFARGGR